MPLYKKGDAKNCNNYRGISLLSAVEKTYEFIIERRLRSKIERTLEEEQSGFRKGYYINYHISAFDRVKREYIWKALEVRRVEDGLLIAIKGIYAMTKIELEQRI